MTDLTEQWKKGELPSGWYYTKLWKGCNVIDYFIGNQFLRYDDSDIVEVIAPVPTFEKLQNMNKSVNECMAANIKLVEENKQLKEYERIVTSYNMKPIDYDIACETVNKLLDDNKRLKHDVGNLGYKIKNQRHEIDNRLKEIDRLKELLKECKMPLEVYNEMFGNKAELLTKIDEVLR